MVENGNSNFKNHQAAVTLAGFSILESLLLSLMDNGVLDAKEIRCLLTDAAQAHCQQAGRSDQAELHKAVAIVIEEMRDGGNTTRVIEWQRRGKE